MPSQFECPVTTLWGKTPYSSRPTTDVEPPEALDLIIQGYREGALDPGAVIADGLEVVLNEQLAFYDLVPEKCPVTQLHQQAFAAAPGSGIDVGRAFKLLLAGYGLGRLHTSGLSEGVVARLKTLDAQAAALKAALPEELSADRAALIANLRERQAAPAPVRDTIPAIPPGVLEPVVAPTVVGAPEHHGSPQP